MHWDRFEGSWRQLKGQVKQTSGRLTDDEVDQIAGSKLLGKVQEKYGLTKEDALCQVSDFERDRREAPEPMVR